MGEQLLASQEGVFRPYDISTYTVLAVTLISILQPHVVSDYVRILTYREWKKWRPWDISNNCW
jgi:hypothetical protein